MHSTSSRTDKQSPTALCYPLVARLLLLPSVTPGNPTAAAMLLFLAALLQGAVATSIFDFQAVDIHGVNQNLSKYKGQVSIIVNVASEWRMLPSRYYISA